MRIIANGRDTNIKLWYGTGSQECAYRLMRYLIFKSCSEGVLILNSVTGELILLNENEKNLIMNLPANYRPEMNDLIEHRILVPERFDDVKSVDQLRQILRKIGFRDSIRTFSILPTTSCNARCFYCYEARLPRHTMTIETADKVVDFILAHRAGERIVNLHWFGGEPTVGEAIIDRICKHLTEKDVVFRSGMISNGYLFSEEMAHKAKKEWRLHHIQITLDGTEEIYNRTKAYTDAKDSPFCRVINNIGYLLDAGVKVNVRLNLDFHNTEDLRELIIELASRFAKYSDFSMYVHELFENKGFKPINHDEAERIELIKCVNTLNDLITSKGCKQSGKSESMQALPSLKCYYCMADNPHMVMINPLGQIGKCEHDIFCHLVGDIYQDIDCNSPSAHYWRNSRYRSFCQTCPLYPYCGRMEFCENAGACSAMVAQRKIQAVREKMLSKLVKTK